MGFKKTGQWCLRRLRMWSDRNDGYLIFLGSITPEHTVCAWRPVLSVGFKYFLFMIIRVRKRAVFVGVKPRMTGVTL